MSKKFRYRIDARADAIVTYFVDADSEEEAQEIWEDMDSSFGECDDWENEEFKSIRLVGNAR